MYEVELPSSLDSSSDSLLDSSSSIVGGFFFVVVTIGALILLSRPGESGGGTCVGLVALSLIVGNHFFGLVLGPIGEECSARESI